MSLNTDLMRVFNDQKSLKEHVKLLKSKENISIGFVPTMGALHDGHASLIERSVIENDITICSIFVNPTQFNDKKDLKNYPIQHDKDLELLEQKNCTIVYLPDSAEDVYQNESDFSIELNGLDKQLEGKFRPGHFDGVMRVVKLLFEITTPDKAYFGLKDYQQYLIIKEMTKQLSLPIEIIGCEIKRDFDGLALSSRNSLLTVHELHSAHILKDMLTYIKEKINSENFEQTISFAKDKINTVSKVDYIEIANAETLESVSSTNFDKINDKRAFVAAFFGNVRLIDNIDL